MRLQRRMRLVLSGIAIVVLSGSVQAQSATPVRLTLQDAISRGLQNNLGALVAESRVQESRGTVERRDAAMLPRVRFEAPFTIQSRNLRAQGITVPGIPDVVGPFATYDFRVSAEQPVFDVGLVHSKRAALRQSEAVRSDYEQVRNDVVRQVASLYLSAQSAAAQVVAAESRVNTAAALHKLADEQRDAGVATGIDVLRAGVTLSRERQGLVQARNAMRNLLLALSRNIGISPGTEIELAEPLEARSVQLPDVAQAVSEAAMVRADYQSLMKQRDALNEQLRASRARFLPRLALSGNYGALGRTFAQLKGVGQAQATLQFTLFDRDREGERRELEARGSRIEKQINDLRLGIEQEIRQALLNVDSANEEVAVAREGLRLAEQEVELARVRFQNGVTNNIEVVNAQDSLSRAQQNSIIAITRHADARIALAHALGNTEKNFAQYFGNK